MNDTFCILPFINIYLERNGDYIACGESQPVDKNSNINTASIEEAWNDTYFKNLRSDLLNGVKCDNCKVCWMAESRGMVSDRQEVNDAYKNLVPEVIAEVMPTLPVILGIKSDDTCNLKCIMCNQYQSSQHAKEVTLFREQGVQVPKWLDTIDEIFKGKFFADDYIVANLDTLLQNQIKLEIQGGEPLISPTTHKLLDYCIANGYTDIELNMTINLTSLTDSMLDKLTKFPNKKLWISWDHIEDAKFRYIRFPATYPVFLKNLDKLIKAGNTNLGISIAVSIFNIFEIDKILDTFENYGIKWLDVIFRIVYQPDYFAIEYLEPEQKQQAVGIINNYLTQDRVILDPKMELYETLNDVHKIILHEPVDFDEVVKERTRVLDLYDRTRNTDYKTLFPFIKRYE